MLMPSTYARARSQGASPALVALRGEEPDRDRDQRVHARRQVERQAGQEDDRELEEQSAAEERCRQATRSPVRRASGTLRAPGATADVAVVAPRCRRSRP